MIRKSGWLIFLLALALVFALLYLLAGTAIRHGLKYSLEKAVGAEVDIRDVSLGLAPLSIEVKGLQMTDPNTPTQNTLSFSRAHADIELWPALLGYRVIDELSIDGLAYGTQRSTAGKVFKKSAEEKNSKASVDLASTMKLDLPKADELMARANLQTEAKGEALRQQASEQKQTLQSLQSQLPDKAKLDKIQSDIKALQQSKIKNAADLAAKTEQLKALQDELKTERDKVRNVQKQLAQSRDSLKQALSGLRDASAADWQQLQKLANLRNGGLAPLSQILLGDFWGKHIAQLEALYKMAKPYIPKKQDSEKAQDEKILPNRLLPLPRQAYPDFWIKSARINWLIGGGNATISAKDITVQHRIINAPTRFSADVHDLPKLSAFTLNGEFSIFDKMKTDLKWQLKGLALDSSTIGKGDNALELTSGKLASSGSMTLVDQTIDQNADIQLQGAIFDSASNQTLSKLAKLLNKQSQIPLSVGVSGTIENPEVHVRSKLDSIIGDALLGEAKEKVAALQQQLREQLDAKLKEQLGAQSEWASLLDKRDAETKALNERIDEMLKTKLANAKDSAKDKLKERLLKAGGKN